MIDTDEVEARIEREVRKLIDSHAFVEMVVEAANLTEEERAYLTTKPMYELWIFGDHDELLKYQADNEYEEYAE